MCGYDEVDMNPSNFDNLKFSIDAYNGANQQTNKLWSAAALQSIVVLTATHSPKGLSIFGIPFDNDIVLPMAILVLSGLNIAYSVAHASAYRLGQVYQSIVREHFGTTVAITPEFTWNELALRAPISNFNRLYPLFEPVEKKIGRRRYDICKMSFDVVFCGFPAFIIVLGTIALPRMTLFLYAMLMFIATISVSFTALLINLVKKYPSMSRP